MLKDTLQADLKKAMLAGESEKVEVLRGLKSAILYAEVAAKKRDNGLSDDEILQVFKSESKKRQESADMFIQGGNTEKASAELREKSIIDGYLPQQLSDVELTAVIATEIAKLGLEHITKPDMGKVIGAVKTAVGQQADGARIAKLVQDRITPL